MLFRIFLAIPQLIWLGIWASVVYGGGGISVSSFSWVVTLFSGRLWPELHAFQARYLRFSTHVLAYVALLADPWPRFDARDAYPIDIAVDAPARQNRWKTGFRIILAIPAIVFTIVLVVVLVVVAIIGWFACLILGRMPKGLRDLGAYCLRFNAQTTAYLLYLTDRYPSLGSEGAFDEPPAA